MKKIFILLPAVYCLAICYARAQCTTTIIDWDYRQFFGQSNSTITSYVPLARAQNQAFAIGANKLTITHNYTGNNTAGDNASHTGETGSYGTGKDVQFTGNGTITLTFQNTVTNLKFSLYDIDRYQRVQFSASNGANAIGINLSRVNNNVVSFTNNGSTNARVDANSYTSANNSADGTVNVDVAGPVKQVVLTISATGTNMSENGVFWLSDITACAMGSFPSNYFGVSQPFTNMPNYVLAVKNDSVFYINPANGTCKFLFADPGPGNINSMAYDPYNRFVYYTYSQTGPIVGGTPSINQNEKSLRRYDYAMDTFGVLVADINTIGMPTFEQGVESGAAAFYNGNLYLGVEGGSQYTNSIIYRVELDASNKPVAASQVYAQEAENSSGTRLHDWSDFGINNGMLYDFDAGASSNNAGKDFYTQNLLTGQVIEYTPLGSLVPRQVAVDWTGKLYNVGSPAATAKGTIAPYNGTNNVDFAKEDTVNFKGAKIVGSWGDAAEAFKPNCDFGDAPASYDPDPLSPAVNERDPNLRIGSEFDLETGKVSSAFADGDGADEDGVSTVSILATAWPTYHIRTTVFNNTGKNATLIGWLDYNGNGVFDAGEASPALTVTSSGVVQTKDLFWSGISSSIPPGSFTYLRLRIASSSLGMTAANATGWFDNGETEDYRVRVEITVLPVHLISFDATVIGDERVRLTWSASQEKDFLGYEVERSVNGRDWETLEFITAASASGNVRDYVSWDSHPYKNTSYYRLRLKEGDGADKYSEVRTVRISPSGALLTLTPNPANDRATISIRGQHGGQTALLRVSDLKGNRLFYRKLTLTGSINTYELPVQSWPSGTYIVSVITNESSDSKKLVLQR